MADLSGFPILRIDQISIIDSDTLADAQKESKDLITNMLAQSPSPIPPMVVYLRKQNDAVSNELMNRLAQERINALLSGASTLLNENRSKYISTPDDDDHSQASISIKTEKNSHTPVKSPAPPPPLPIPSFQPLPLPSEQKKQSISPHITTPTKENTETSTGQYVSPLRRSETSPVGITMSSRSTSDPPTANKTVDDSSTSTAPSKPRRPHSGDSRPSRRSQEFINKNFGSLFIVAGEGKPRRQLPVKKVVEPVEVVKARERLDRRKAAMERLLARKEERQKQQLAKKEAQRAAKREAERQKTGADVSRPGAMEKESKPSPTQRSPQGHTNHTTSNPVNATDSGRVDPGLDPVGDSSGSESVSGGDDDDQAVEISQEMITAVTHAQDEAAVEANFKHASRNGNKSHSRGLRSAEKSSSHDISSVKTSKITFSNVKSPLQRTTSNPASAAPSSAHSPPKASISNKSPSAKLQGSPSVDSKRHATTSVASKPSRRQKGASTTSANTVVDSDTDSSLISHKPRRERTSIRENTVASPQNKAPSNANNSNKRKSIYRTDSENTGITSKSTLETNRSAEDSVDAITKEELEVKTTAALQSLRSMKLKKEQMKLNSFKQALSSTALTASSSTSNSPRQLVTTEPGDDEVEAVDSSSAGALVMLSQQENAVEDAMDDASERAVTAYGDRDVVPVSSGDERQLQSRAAREVDCYIEAEEVEDSERLLLKGSPEFAEPTIRHIRAAHLQVDDEQPCEQPVHRPNTVPLPPSPTRQYEETSFTTAIKHGEITPTRRKTVFSFPTYSRDSAERASIDLSNESLEVCEDKDKFILPVASRTVADATHPAVSQLLAGYVHSCLLYVQDDIYCCKIGTDDLPGLCSWKLASIENECANWVVNIAKYSRVNPLQPCSSAAHAGVFRRRAAMRRSVSLGLLVLLLDTEDILLGKVRLFSAEHFTTLWREYIRLFDEKAEALAVQYGPEVFFTETAVCGNTHAVCKKLENLLKTLFIPNANTAEGQLHRALHAQEELLPPPSPRDDYPIQCNGTVQQQPYSRGGRDKDHSDTGDAGYNSDQDGGQGGSHNQSDADSDDGGDAGAGSLDDDDDDASIVPVYPASLYNQFLELQEKEQQRLDREAKIEAEGGVDRAALVVVEEGGMDTAQDATAEGLHTKQRSRNRVEATKNVQVQKSSVRSPYSSSETAPIVRLTEFYPTLGSIFPAVYSQLSNRPAGDDSTGAAARVLIESMQTQCKMYAEWIEVMSDYSTVFSEERRGCAEHHYDKDKTDEQSEATGNSTVYKGGTRSLHYRVKSGRSEVNNIVTDVFNNYLAQWEELPAGLGLGLSWNILWTWSKPRIKMTHLLAWQRVNHYPDSKELTRKDLLKKNIQRFLVMGGKTSEQFNIMPMTFLLPHEYTAFVQAFTLIEASKTNENIQNFWILKPIGMSRGRGISLVKDLSEIAYSQSSVVQRYIERPLCLQGYKFDLRLYIVVTSFHPLEAFIYRDGFARVSTHQYSLDPEDTGNHFIHLTNSSIQCKNTIGITKDSPLQVSGEEDTDQDTGGSKISLLGNNGLWRRLQEYGIDIAALWQSICILVLKSLVIVDDKIANQPCCFELFGYDVLIDADLRPWLLEVNASPSLARSTPLDVRIKNAVIRDIIHLIDPAPYDRAAVVRILQKRLNSISKHRFTMGRNDPDLEADLRDILGDYVPRKLGEMPKHMGNFEMLCPGTNEYIQVIKLKKKIIKS